MQKYLLMLVCLLVLAACGTNATNNSTVAATPTPVATFPAVGEWQYVAPWSFMQDDFALVLDIQQANSFTDVASMTSVVGFCQGNSSQPFVLARTASASINGTDITVNAIVSYSGGRGSYQTLVATFAGTIQPGGSLALVSSGLQGLHDYLFTPTTGAVPRIQQKFQQDKCS